MKLQSIFKASLAALLLLGTVSCSDSYLDEHMYSKYGASVSDTNAKVLGIYYKVGLILGYSSNQGYAGIWQDGTDVGAPGDVQGVETPFYQYANLNSENAGVSFLWTQLYSIIGAANIIINDETAEPKYRAEASFFRAWAYEQLVTLWGDVPLLTEQVTSPSANFTRAKVAEVDAVINEDLDYAIANLPAVDEYSKAQQSRVNKDAARIWAAQSYLRQGYQGQQAMYSKAVDVITPTINGGKYSLIKARYGSYLNDDGDFYSDMFRFHNQRRSEGNTEGVWTFEMEYPVNVPGGTIDAPQQRRNWVAAFHKLDGMVNADSIGGRGNGRLRLSNYVKYGIWDEGDIRNSNFNIRRILYYNKPGWGGATYYLDKDGYRVPNDKADDPNVVSTVQAYYGGRVYCHAADTLNVLYPHVTKWGGYDPTDDFGWTVVKDFPMMRFSEAYLLRAEAYVRLGDKAKAAADINVLRDRAFGDYRTATGNVAAGKVTDAQMSIDFILDERIRELVGEENRRLTLVRAGELANRVNMMVTKWAEKEPSKQITGFDPKKNILLPIPLTEIQLNQDAELTQNPGY